MSEQEKPQKTYGLCFLSEGNSYPLPNRDEITIGRREENNFCVLDDWVSRYHCAIVRGGDGWYLEDRGSLHGTFIGARRLAKDDRIKLEVGDGVRIGRTSFCFVEIVRTPSTPAVSAEHQHV